MNLTRLIPHVVGSALFLVLLAAPCKADDGPRNATVLVIRHAEKPVDGDGLTPAGDARAKAYVEYFRHFKFESQPVKINAIFAAADSKNSRRPRLTVEPLAQALGLTVNASYKDKDYRPLADELRGRDQGKNILLCWHHGPMPALLRALSADPSTLLPEGRWPSETFDWVIFLRYDANGHLMQAQRIEEEF